MELCNQFLHIPEIPDIAGKAQDVRFLLINLLQNIFYLVVDGIFCNPYMFLIFFCIGFQAVYCKVGMDVFCIYGD